MPPESGSRRRPAPVEALGEAIALVRGRLFPIRLERWLAVGFVAFLDSCGRGGASGSFQFPGGPGGGGAPADGDFDVTVVRDWLAEYVVFIVAAVVLVAFLFLADALPPSIPRPPAS